MTDIKIEKGVPLLKKRYGGLKYPFGKMEVGDSFVFGPEGVDSCASSARTYAIKNNKKFAHRKLGDGRVRIWRIA